MMRHLLLSLAACSLALLAGCARRPTAPVDLLTVRPVPFHAPVPSGAPAPAVHALPAAPAHEADLARLRRLYQGAYDELAGMLAGTRPLSFKRAVYATENAYLGDSLNYQAFDRHLQALAQVCRNIQRANNTNLLYDKDDRENVARNAAVWQVMTDTVFLDRTDKSRYLPPYSYDFEDFDGAKDWRKMFVTKLLVTHTGNCHSLPILYKLLAEEVGAPCWLALAPNHVYVKQHDKKNGWYNTELTSRAFPMDAWLTASGYVSRETIVNGIYLDTLSARHNIVLCLVDLATGYQRRLGRAADEAFTQQCAALALQYFPAYVNGLLLEAESRRRLFEQAPGPATAAAMEAAFTRIYETGYREMPPQQYLAWLRSLPAQKTKYPRAPDSPTR